LLKKVGEEASEVLVAGALESDERLVSEMADLFFHLTVVLGQRDLSWTDVARELERRNA
jgi:phosphoribosyl-ATP pyrophosphohydrolase